MFQKSFLRRTRQMTSLQSANFSSNQNGYQQHSSNGNFVKGVSFVAGAALLAGLYSDETYPIQVLQQTQKMLGSSHVAQCQFKDKRLAGCLDEVDKGLAELERKYPGMKRPHIKSGLRGPKYFIEFNISGRKVDAFSLILSTEKAIQQGSKKKNDPSYAGSKVINTESFSQGDTCAYLIDYQCDSTTAMGGKSKGSVSIRGIKDERGWDSFKFTLEKNVDFHELDSKILLNAIEESIKMMPPKQEPKSKEKNTVDASSGANLEGVGGEENGTPADPVTVLEKHNCTVFMPDQRQNKLDWDYLAGYDKVKRDIEDTVLLALTNADIYDQITALTRMKNETNRPKCVLFEGPPGCGKTTSAKIISHQVNIPLVYMPLEAIMSKFYGESESKLAEIFEAAQGMGSVILFIDEIDSLATSREAGLHEATRRILSTLLRKIDSFESDGEVLVICATNRKKDLDPALISRTDLSIRFDLPDASTRTAIFSRYAKQLSEEQLNELGHDSINLSGRDISDICKDAERKWASKYIRKQVTALAPEASVYKEALQARLIQMKDANVRMDFDVSTSPYTGSGVPHPQSLAFGGK